VIPVPKGRTEIATSLPISPESRSPCRSYVCVCVCLFACHNGGMAEREGARGLEREGAGGLMLCPPPGLILWPHLRRVGGFGCGCYELIRWSVTLGRRTDASARGDRDAAGHAHQVMSCWPHTQPLVPPHTDKHMSSYAPVTCYRCARNHVVKQLMCGGK
jgi:hypothetical protein